jgi:chromate transporter
MGELLQLFIAFFRVGLLGFGNGQSTILIQEEVVDRYHWVTAEEFADAFAMANTIPGPVATKLAAMFGYQVSGWTGGIIAIIAMVTPSFFLAILATKLYVLWKDSPRVAGMMTIMKPVVVVLLLQIALETGKHAFPDMNSWIVAVVTAVAAFYFKVSPTYIVIIAMATGLLWHKA